MSVRLVAIWPGSRTPPASWRADPGSHSRVRGVAAERWCVGPHCRANTIQRDLGMSQGGAELGLPEVPRRSATPHPTCAREGPDPDLEGP